MKVRLEKFITSDVNVGIKTIDIDLRFRCKMKLADAFLAATAGHLRISLITRDTQCRRLKGEVGVRCE